MYTDVISGQSSDVLDTSLKSGNFQTIPGTVLLFGEYSILYASKALVMPYHGFVGRFELGGDQTKSHETIKLLVEYLKDKNFCHLDFDKLDKDLRDGLYFNSKIPIGQGMGSSGAITAALMKSYGKDIHSLSHGELKKQLGAVESFFHGTSSGFDPLVCYLDDILLNLNDGEIRPVQFNTNSKIKPKIYLISTGEKRNGRKVISKFMTKMSDPGFKKNYNEHYIPLNDKCISEFQTNYVAFKDSLKELSQQQLDLFLDTMSLEVQLMWKTGLSSEDYFMKLCGAGGGGFYLAFSFKDTFKAPQGWIQIEVSK